MKSAATRLSASFCPAGRRRCTTLTRRPPIPASSVWACRCSASVTACSSWCTSSAERCAPRTSASTAMPRLKSRMAPGFSRPARKTLRLDVARRRSGELPAGFHADRQVLRTRSPPSKIRSRKMWAVQFHPEVHHTQLGHGHPAQLRSQHLRREADLDSAALHRRHHRQRPPARWAQGAPSARSPAASIPRSRPRWWIVRCATPTATRA